MIITCGFVSSGTRLLHTIVDYHMGVPALHRSFPHWDEFWLPEDFPDDARWVVIHRRPEIAFTSAHAAGHPGKPDGSLGLASMETIKSWYPAWMAISDRLRPAYHLQYEGLIENARYEIDRLAAWLQVDTPLKSYPQIRDENAKYDES